MLYLEALINTLLFIKLTQINAVGTSWMQVPITLGSDNNHAEI